MRPYPDGQDELAEMTTLVVELFDEELEQLTAAAGPRGLSAPALAQRWIRERLVHERERAEGGGRPMSPRSRREAGEDAPE